MIGSSGAIVPAAWGAYNGLWIILLAAFGASAVPLWLYGGAAALIELAAALLVVLHWRRQARLGHYVLFARGEAAVIGAVGTVLLGLGPALGAWLYPPGAVTLLWAAYLVGRDGRWRRRELDA